MFFEDRFEHAFFTTSDRYRHEFAKDVLARDRVACVRWIGPILRGEVPNTQCWESLKCSGIERKKRLCIASAELYVIWLDARSDGSWRFSTAYVARAEQARNYAFGKRLCGRFKGCPVVNWPTGPEALSEAMRPGVPAGCPTSC